MTFLKKKKGFTLIELLVVISIIGVLSTIVLSSLNDARSRSQAAKTLATAKNISTALELFYIDNGSYPNSGHAGTTNWEPICDQTNQSLQDDLSLYMSGLFNEDDCQKISYSSRQPDINYIPWCDSVTFSDEQGFIIIFTTEQPASFDEYLDYGNSGLFYHCLRHIK